MCSFSKYPTQVPTASVSRSTRSPAVAISSATTGAGFFVYRFREQIASRWMLSCVAGVRRRDAMAGYPVSGRKRRV